MKKPIKVEQDPEKPVETKVLAQAIVDIGKAARALADSGLNQKAIVVLVAHDSKQPQYVVKTIDLSAEPGKPVRITTRRVSLSVSSDVQRVAPDNVLRLDCGYFEDGGQVVWDVAGIYLADAEQRGNFVYVSRRMKPVPSLPEGYSRRWQTLIDGAGNFGWTPGPFDATDIANAEMDKCIRADAERRCFKQPTPLTLESEIQARFVFKLVVPSFWMRAAHHAMHKTLCLLRM